MENKVIPLASSHPAGPFAIETHELGRVYTLGYHQQIQALRNVNLQVQAGKLVILRGRSGSGKTSLLNCLGGLDRPSSGSVIVFGTEIAKLSDKRQTQWRRDQVGFVFQSFGLLPTLSAYENVELSLRIAGRAGKISARRTQECLELVGLSHWSHHRPYELSGGQQQRVAIARSLANRPRLILADEPTGELDSAHAREILSLFRRIVAEEGVTLVVASHDPLVTEFADLVLYLKDGQLLQPSP